ncbi:hypothetical protein AB205_0082600 [Aquarana catesbeiana]|uniref:Uncharacterized protein n=1 Tax=Aquarana catesbeiana TaxID=8400 RepID=A0A2G9Q2P4_AQUCT|nr:hypothetical protein AB205_0082600 [Aquarana catesbeiana]
MFHITIPGLKYLCAKYSFCFIHIGEKRLRQAEPSAPPPQHPNWEISPSPTEDVEEGEVGDMGTPQVIWLWKKQAPAPPPRMCMK